MRKVTLLMLSFVITITTSSATTGTLIHGLNGNSYDGIATFENMTEDRSSNRTTTGFFYDSFADGDNNGWIVKSGTWDASEGFLSNTGGGTNEEIYYPFTYKSNTLLGVTYEKRWMDIKVTTYPYSYLYTPNSTTFFFHYIRPNDGYYSYGWYDGSSTFFSTGTSFDPTANNTWEQLSFWRTEDGQGHARMNSTQVDGSTPDPQNRTDVRQIKLRGTAANELFNSIRVWDTTTGNLTLNYTTNISKGEEISSIQFNGTVDAKRKVDVYGSNSNSTFILIQLNVTPASAINIRGTGYQYIRWRTNSSIAYDAPIMDNETAVISGIGATGPTITSLPEGTVTSYENVAQTFTVASDQIVNVTWYMKGTPIQTNTSVVSASYINSTALNASSPYSLTASISNINGINSTTFNWNVLLNSFDCNWKYWNLDSGGLVAAVDITNITTGLQSIHILLNDTNSSYLYTVIDSSGNTVDRATATYESGTLNFIIPLVEDSYSITETLSNPALELVSVTPSTLYQNSTGSIQVIYGITIPSGRTINESSAICKKS